MTTRALNTLQLKQRLYQPGHAAPVGHNWYNSNNSKMGPKVLPPGSLDYGVADTKRSHSSMQSNNIQKSLHELITKKLFQKFVLNNPALQPDASQTASSGALPPITIGPQQPEGEAADFQTQMHKYISSEVKKMLHSTTKVSQQSLDEIEHKVQLEVYLRSKKQAILQDRDPSPHDLKKVTDVDAESHLSAVKSKLLPGVQTAVNAKSVTKQLSQQQAKQWLDSATTQLHTSSKALPACDEADEDEWLLLTQYQLVKDFQNRQQKQTSAAEAKISLRQELQRQQKQYQARQQLQKEQTEAADQSMLHAESQRWERWDQQQKQRKMKLSQLYAERNAYAAQRESMLKKEKQDRKSSDALLLQEIQDNEKVQFEKEKRQKLKTLDQMKQIAQQAEVQMHAKRELFEIQKQTDKQAMRDFDHRLEKHEQEREAHLKYVRDKSPPREKAPVAQSQALLQTMNLIENQKLNRLSEQHLHKWVYQHDAQQQEKEIQRFNQDKAKKMKLRSDLNSHSELQMYEKKQKTLIELEADKIHLQQGLEIERQNERRELEKSLERQKKINSSHLELKQQLTMREQATEKAKVQQMSSHEGNLNKRYLEEARQMKKRGDFQAIENVVKKTVDITYKN